MNVSSFISQRISGKGNSNKFITFAKSVAVISVALGTMALIISLSILNGFDKSLRAKAIKFTSHITVSSFDRATLPNYEDNTNRLNDAFPEISGIEPIIEGQCLFRYNESVEGFIFRGVIPEKDINSFRDNIIEGNYAFSDSAAKEIIISKSIADKLNIAIGNDAIIYVVKIENTQSIPFPKVNKFKVVAIYETGMSKYDDNLIMMPFHTAQKMLSMQSGNTSKYEININDISNARIIADSIDLVLGYPHFAITVFDLHRAIFSWIELQKEPIPLVLGLISIVAVLNIITALLLLVVEKTNTVGILRTLGMRRVQLIKVFIWQGLRLGFIGTASGLAIAFLFSIAQEHFGIIRLNGELYFLDKLPVDISASYYIIVASVSMFLSFISSFFPALIAVRISPLRAIRMK